MTNLLDQEPLVLISVLAGEVPSPRARRPVGGNTIWRWLSKGVRAPNGRVVKLEALRIAGRYYSSREALGRFISAQQETTVAGLPASRPPATRQRESDRAAEELKAAGL